MEYLLQLFNILISGCYYLLYPFLRQYLAKKNYLGAITAEGRDSQQGILFHAASVGEVNAIKPLILKLLNQMPEKNICISTTTLTGQKLAQKISDKLQVVLSALDIKQLRYSQLNKIKPALICIVETEIWPNLLSWAAQHHVPVIFVSARMSETSYPRYRLLKFLIRYLERPVSVILAQSPEDKKRFSAIFTKPVKYLGNIKLSLDLPEISKAAIRSEWGYRENDFIICWGSSRPGEESLFLSLLPELSCAIPNLKVILAPRHPERIPEVKRILAAHEYELYSQAKPQKSAPIMVIDKLGILYQAYALCDLAIIGGSFFDFGGHNPLEAAFYEKPIIIGPYHQACRESVKILSDSQAIIVSEARILAEDIITLALDSTLREAMGKRAKKVLTDNAECVDKYLAEISNVLGE